MAFFISPTASPGIATGRGLSEEKRHKVPVRGNAGGGRGCPSSTLTWDGEWVKE
ncbi:MAG TPA: hypothetical protein PLX87_07975 [Bacteroidales bacterium]|nr:hypothetical protein [Bacteroidales bacterium]HOK74432.1 hypothetical protein [Bacteroidales bacterium]HOM40629.1 hypothetical protein [Bacteroidales bacterium]HOU30603.1 hypothetical protein [Bacteroidales bacterium]HPP92676.1 hypothetical protein [Bacteroidales bacterium]